MTHDQAEFAGPDPGFKQPGADAVTAEGVEAHHADPVGAVLVRCGQALEAQRHGIGGGSGRAPEVSEARW